MIITKQKPFLQILDMLKDDDKVFLVGCTLCATTCKTGGEKQIKKIEEALTAGGKTVTGWYVPDPACSILAVKRLYRKYKEQIDSADVILSFACGGGTQAIAEVITSKRVYPANDTLFQGEITVATLKKSQFDQKCSLCGQCILDITASICPVTRCAKGLRNGPCGGIKNGKCEVDSNLDCAWLLIYEKLKETGRLDNMKVVQQPRDNSKSRNPQNLIIED